MTEWWASRDAFAQELAEHGSIRQIVAVHGGIGMTKARRLRVSYGLELPKTEPQRPTATSQKVPKSPAEKPGVEISGDRARVTSDASVELGDLDEIIRARGLDPDEWLVERVKVNEWEGFMRGEDGEPRVVLLHQLTAHLKRKVTWDWLVPATEVAARWIPPVLSRAKNRSWLVFVGGDQQAPYHDEQLHETVCRWLHDVQPDELALTGDTTDNPTISRHQDRPFWDAAPQECVDTAFRLLSDYCDAAPKARKRKLRGNHDWRIESEMLKRAERLFGLRPARRDGEEEQPMLYSLRRLLRLDELGIELVGREGDDWRFGEIELTPGLVVRHQPPSQMKVARLNASVMAGDSHKQRVTHVSQQVNGAWLQRTVVEVGTLAMIRGGLGYAPDADWQQGFATVAIYPDGTTAFDLAKWDGNALTWRGDVWKP